MNCDCRIDMTHGESIVYCPLHAAAPDMYSALSVALDDWERHRTLDYAVTKIKKAQAKADGKA